MIPIDVSAGPAMSPFKPHWDLYPATYVAQKTSYPLFDYLDGDLTKDVWSDVRWSEYFDDIRGVEDAPTDDRPDANSNTRFKALWDDTHIYIGALIETDFETVAEFKARNSPIFQKDSDFEVFIDPIGSCHWYKELEVNAINTIWNLMLDKPYGDGGSEHSGRIARPGDKQYYDVYHQKTKVRLLKGKLNNPDEGATWSLEIAISYKDIMATIQDIPKPPTKGTMWRINFSRVENKGDTNWTWQPQIAWDPKNRRFAGFVDMHRPDAWGTIVFGGPVGKVEDSQDPMPRDSAWPGRLAAINVYYAQATFFEENGSYASNMEQLTDLLASTIIAPFDICIDKSDDDDGFLATITGCPDGSIVTVTHDRHLKVYPMTAEVSEE